ncbi:MAG: hypothetical protein CM1200mP40_08140 [Gammaproteobacteria bacterium]|nr:MAG: hypothetical protein CM1200mP40_08140 [Gammaproteobacteria bacterium]
MSYILNQNKYTTPLMQRIEYGDEAAVKFRRLYDLIKNNHSYLVFQCIKELKATLSDQESAVLDIPELDVELLVTRNQFDSYIQEVLRKFEQSIFYLMKGGEPGAARYTTRYPNRGSSLIPAVKNILDACFQIK